jgi:hypothetical protein
MSYNEETELIELKEKINNTPKPDCIDEYIKNGIRLAQTKKKKTKAKRLANVAVLVVFLILSASIRISPVFASYISKVPGLQYLVTLINFDKGIKDAVDNDFIQSINMSQEHEGLVFTIKDMIIDNSKAILFYSIENKANHKFVNIAEIKLKDKNGKDVIACSTMDLFVNQDISKQKELVGKVEFSFNNEETILPDTLFIEVLLEDEDINDAPISHDKRNILASTWKFNTPIDKEKFETMKKIYTLNEKIEVEGQKILFKTVTITPTLIAAEIEYDNNNSKKILGYDDITFINEKGEKWATISSGVSGSRKDENHETLFFQSNYFTSPKELYIKGSSIKALDKDKLKVIVDIDKKLLLNPPDDKLTLKSVTDINGEISLQFGLLKDEILDKDRGYSVFQSIFKDSDGNMFDNNSLSVMLTGNNKQGIVYTIPSKSKYKNPIYLTIDSYPSRIKGDFKVKIK